MQDGVKVGATIKKLRQSKNVTQEQLAEYLSISFQSVSKWETGVSVPDVHLLPKLARYFGVSIEDLFDVSLEEKLERIGHGRFKDGVTAESFEYACNTLLPVLANEPDRYDVLEALIHTYRGYAMTLTNTATSYAKRLVERHASNTDLKKFGGFKLLGDVLDIPRKTLNTQLLRTHEFVDRCEPHVLKRPDDRETNAWLAGLCIELRDFARAQAFLANTGPEKPFLEGEIALFQGKPEEAYAAWHQAANPEDRTALYFAGLYFERYAQAEDAIRYYEAALALAPKGAGFGAIQSLIYLYRRLHRYEDAIAMNERVISLNEEWGFDTDRNEIRWRKEDNENMRKKIAQRAK